MLAQERFKELEREIKLKPFAKAALSVHAREKVDPAALAKAEAQAWLRRAVATLAEQKERIEVRGRASCLFSCEACSCRCTCCQTLRPCTIFVRRHFLCRGCSGSNKSRGGVQSSPCLLSRLAYFAHQL